MAYIFLVFANYIGIFDKQISLTMDYNSNHELICTAISFNLKISFDYKDRDEIVYTKRLVSPHFIFEAKTDGSLLLKANFIDGHSKSRTSSTNIRSYSIDKMMNIVITEDSFEPDFSLMPQSQTLKMECSVF